MLALPKLLPYEVLFSGKTSLGGGGSSCGALRAFFGGVRGGSSNGVGEEGRAGTGEISPAGSSTGCLVWLKKPGAGSSAS